MAKGKLGQGEYDFIAGAATDEITLRRTRAVFDAILLRPRMMVDISQRDLRTTVLGQDIRFPIMLDPAGNHAAAHPDGELASARAAGAAGTILVLSAQSSRTLEEVAQTATGPLWFQQYFFKERSLTLDMAHGARGVIVSNHGARYLDTTLATIEALPEVVEAVAGKAEVYMDGGIRRGADVFKALALGARAVLIGRPVFWGLAVEVETGVRAVLEMLRDELDATMGMCGRTTVDSVDRECLVDVSPLLALFPHAAPFR